MKIDQIFPKVQAIIADVLMLEKDEVSLDKRLISDLGAESIDFLDLTFQLEKSFAIKIPRGQMEIEARSGLSEAEYEQSGFITSVGMSALKKYFSEVPAEYFKDKMKVSEIPLLFTVETFCKIVARNLVKAES